MVNFWHLMKGEIIRLFKYKIIYFGFLVSLIWVLILGFSDRTTALSLAPSLMVMDAGMMSVILLAASFYYEKQEGTVKSLLVAPINVHQLLWAKICAMIVSGFISMILVGGAAFIFHQITVSIPLLFGLVILTVAANVIIGYVITLASKDFISMLVKYMGVIVLFYTPILLMQLSILNEFTEILCILSPIYAGQLLIDALFQSNGEPIQIILSVFYLLGLIGLIYPYVYHRYQKVAIGG